MINHWETSNGSYRALEIAIDVLKVLAVLVVLATIVSVIGVISDDTMDDASQTSLAVGSLFGGLIVALGLFVGGAVLDVYLGIDARIGRLAEDDEKDE
jgi:hypothetical protein